MHMVALLKKSYQVFKCTVRWDVLHSDVTAVMLFIETLIAQEEDSQEEHLKLSYPTVFMH